MSIIRGEFEAALARHGWMVGSFVVMPDHLHFFCAPGGNDIAAPLSRFIGAFKQWSAKDIVGVANLSAPLWQREFFNHVLRSKESYDAKQQYVMANPVRAGLVLRPEDWPYRGEIPTDALG
jgi:putative transposase